MFNSHHIPGVSGANDAESFECVSLLVLLLLLPPFQNENRANRDGRVEVPASRSARVSLFRSTSTVLSLLFHAVTPIGSGKVGLRCSGIFSGSGGTGDEAVMVGEEAAE